MTVGELLRRIGPGRCFEDHPRKAQRSGFPEPCSCLSEAVDEVLAAGDGPNVEGLSE